MKKFIAIVAVTLFVASCNSGGSSSESTDKKMNADSTGNSMMSTTAEGTMRMKGGKMMIMTAGAWVPMDKPMMCTDSCKVTPDGEVTMKNGEKMMMKEGESIGKDGMMTDASGKMMDMKMDDKMMNDSSKKM
jgi:hypothetical protein